MGESRTFANFSVANKLVVPVVLGTTIFRKVHQVNPFDRKKNHPTPLPAGTYDNDTRGPEFSREK